MWNMLKVVFVVKFKQFTPCSSVSIVNFEHVIADSYFVERYMVGLICKDTVAKNMFKVNYENTINVMCFKVYTKGTDILLLFFSFIYTPNTRTHI